MHLFIIKPPFKSFSLFNAWCEWWPFIVINAKYDCFLCVSKGSPCQTINVVDLQCYMCYTIYLDQMLRIWCVQSYRVPRACDANIAITSLTQNTVRSEAINRHTNGTPKSKPTHEDVSYTSVNGDIGWVAVEMQWTKKKKKERENKGKRRSKWSVGRLSLPWRWWQCLPSIPSAQT